MKKVFALILALVMILGLAACGAQPEAPATEAPKAEASATEAPVVEDTNDDGSVKVFLVSPLIGGSAWGNCQKGF